MYILNNTKAIKTTSINEVKDFIFENYFKRIGFSKKVSYISMKHLNKKYLSLLANKLIKNIPDPINAKEHYESFIIKKTRKPVKQSEIVTYRPKTFDIVDVKSIITEHRKTSYKLPKIIRQAEKVGCNTSLYKDTKKSEYFLNEKKKKITKREHAFKGYVSTYNVEILNSFNPELQLKEIESTIKSKLVK